MRTSIFITLSLVAALFVVETVAVKTIATEPLGKDLWYKLDINMDRNNRYSASVRKNESFFKQVVHYRKPEYKIAKLGKDEFYTATSKKGNTHTVTMRGFSGVRVMNSKGKTPPVDSWCRLITNEQERIEPQNKKLDKTIIKCGMRGSFEPSATLYHVDKEDSTLIRIRNPAMDPALVDNMLQVMAAYTLENLDSKL